MQVHSKGTMLDIVQAQTDLFWANQFVVSTMWVRAAAQDFVFVPELDGSPIRDAGANEQQIFFFITVADYFFHNFRARPNKAHFTLQHVQQLRQFVKLIFPQKVSGSCDARVICRCLGPADLFGIQHHGAQLADAKGPPQTTSAYPAIKHRPWGVEGDPYCASRQQWRDNQKSTRGDDDIKKPFHCCLALLSCWSGPVARVDLGRAGLRNTCHRPASVPTP